jgi:hypothetical protein
MRVSARQRRLINNTFAPFPRKATTEPPDMISHRGGACLETNSGSPPAEHSQGVHPV